MNAYLPADLASLAWVVLVLTAIIGLGFVVSRLRPGAGARALAWLLVVGGVLAVERLAATEPAGVRMLVIIAALLYSMKAVVAVEARADGMAPLPPGPWLGFALLWPGMRPGLFADVGQPARAGAGALFRQGSLRLLIGAMLIGLARIIWERGEIGYPTAPEVVRWLATVPLLIGLSLVVHFGVFALLTAVWRRWGVDARPLFRAPLAASSLSEFWGRRWNLAFAEMTALGVYRPLTRVAGRRVALLGAFLTSGILHELAISVPVRAGFGLPLAYFSLHGLLVGVERLLERRGRPVASWGPWRHVWTLGWLALPAPVLFHQPFLEGVVWPLIGAA
jgi:alginate O-acetyltransferase complex protein AlgI